MLPHFSALFRTSPLLDTSTLFRVFRFFTFLIVNLFIVRFPHFSALFRTFPRFPLFSLFSLLTYSLFVFSLFFYSIVLLFHCSLFVYSSDHFLAEILSFSFRIPC